MPHDDAQAWHALVEAARHIPSRAKARLPHLTPEDLAILAALVDEALAAGPMPLPPTPHKETSR
jgi:hypothetical protein